MLQNTFRPNLHFGQFEIFAIEAVKKNKKKKMCGIIDQNFFCYTVVVDFKIVFKKMKRALLHDLEDGIHGLQKSKSINPLEMANMWAKC